MPTDKHRESIKRTPEQFGVFFILSEYQFFRKYFTTFSQIYLTFGNVALYLQRQNEDKMRNLNRKNPFHWIIAVKRVLQSRIAKKYKTGYLRWKNPNRDGVKFVPSASGGIKIIKQYPKTFDDAFKDNRIFADWQIKDAINRQTEARRNRRAYGNLCGFKRNTPGPCHSF